MKGPITSSIADVKVEEIIGQFDVKIKEVIGQLGNLSLDSCNIEGLFLSNIFLL